MKTLPETTLRAPDLAALFAVQISWAKRNQWERGESLEQISIGAESLWLMESGELLVESGEQRWRVRAGEMFLWPREKPRRILSTRVTSWLTIGLDAQLFGRIAVLKLLQAPQHWQPEASQSARFAQLIFPLIHAPRDTAGGLLRDGLGRALTALLWCELRDDDLLLAARDVMPNWLQKTLQIAQVQTAIGVLELAREAGFSPAQFRRVFSQWMGLSPREYLQNQKLEAARALLENSDLSIAEIAGQSGFADATHFGRAWKKSFAATPAAWRKTARSANSQI